MTTETAAPQHESDADVSERLAAPLDLLLDAPTALGSPEHPPLTPAPGTYVCDR